MFKKNKIFFFFLILLLIHRVFLLLANFDIFIQDEERYNGTIAIEMIRGLKMPLFFYQHQPYAPGAMIMGVLAAPFYLLFGESYMSLKYLALAVTILLFSFWYFFVRRIAGEQCAILFSLFFVFAPPNAIKYSVLALGNHYESCLFTIVVIYLMTVGLYEKSGDRNPDLLFIILAGVISGFATYFVLTFIATVVLCLFFWFLKDRLFFASKAFVAYALSFCAGFLPWIYNTIKYGAMSLNFHGTPIYLAEADESVLSKTIRYLTTGMSLSFGFEGIGWSNIDSFLYYTVVMGAVVYFFFRYRRDVKNLFICLFSFARSGKEDKGLLDGKMVLAFFPLVFSSIFIASGFKVPKKKFFDAMFYNPFDTYYYLSYRYFVPLFPFVFFFMALFICFLFSEKKKTIRVWSGYFIIVLILGLTGNSYYKLAIEREWFKGSLYTGSDYMVLGKKITEVYGNDLPDVYRKLSDIDEGYKVAAFRGAGIAVGNKDDGLKKIISLMQESSEIEKKWLIQGYSNGLFERAKIDVEALDIKAGDEKIEIDDIFKTVPSYLLPVVKREIGKISSYSCNFKTESEIKASIKFLDRVHQRYDASFEDLHIHNPHFSNADFWNIVTDDVNPVTAGFIYCAIGKDMSFIGFDSTATFNSWLEKTDPLYRQYLIDGIAETSGPYFKDDFGKVLKTALSLPDEYSKRFISSAGEAFFWKNWDKVGDIKSLPETAVVADNPSFYRGIGRGAGYLLWWNKQKSDDILSKVDEKHREEFLSGMRERIDETFDITIPSYYRYFNLRIEY